ncbi:MAG: DUF3791 domain-containing protein [Propionibacteriaceae bacterium]|nr:DUF3791 domain-containing protein [Propionibacteriaceae bacterium]
MENSFRPENLLVVAAVEGYSRRHHIHARETIRLFDSKDIFRKIRENSAALCTQSLEESIDFAEDVLARHSM